MNNLKIFDNLTDRQNITEAYSKICESSNHTASKSKDKISSSDSHVDRVYALDFLTKTYPNIPTESLIDINDAIAEYVGADESDGEFIYHMPDVEVDFHVENDGIGYYEYWGHEEYDAGSNYAVLDGYDGEITDNVPDGSVLVFDDDEGRLSEEANEHCADSSDYGDGSDGSFSTSVLYKLYVTEPNLFKMFIERLSDEKNINLGEMKTESVDRDDLEIESDRINFVNLMKRISFNSSELCSKLRKLRMNINDEKTASAMIDDIILMADNLSIEAGAARNISEVM